MRARHAFLVMLLVAIVAVPLLTNRGAAGQQVMTGTVLEWHESESIVVANEQTDPAGVRIALRDTAYERDPRAITPGTRVTVWYRSVGERRPVADKVQVIADATP